MLHRDPLSLQSLAMAASITCEWADAMSPRDVSESEKFRYKCWTLIDFLHQIAASQSLANEAGQVWSGLTSSSHPAAFYTGATGLEQPEPDFAEALSPQSFVGHLAEGPVRRGRSSFSYSP
jgi:hypothetical protein